MSSIDSAETPLAGIRDWGNITGLLATWCFAAACAIALVGAFVGLDAFGLWFDELFTVRVLEPAADSGGLLSRIATDVHPPIYPVLLFLYSKVAGNSDAAIRSFSALAACAAVLTFIAATKSTFSLAARLFAAALATGSLFWFFQSQNARSYALCLLIGAGILALCLSNLADRPERHRRLELGGLIALMFVGSFVHFYVLYESLAALIVLFLFKRGDRYVLTATAVALVVTAALYMKLVMMPFSQASLDNNWYPNNPGWYVQVLESCLQYTYRGAGAVAIVVCATVALHTRMSAPSSAAGRFAIDPVTALLVGVPVLVLLGAIVSSSLLAPNFYDRNFLVLSPFLWGISARLYDVATIAARPLVRAAVNVTLSIVVLAVASTVMQRLPSERPTVLYEPFRESAEWIRGLPECRGQIIPVITTDHVAWYRPGFAQALYGTIYGYYLQDFARPQLIFMEDLAKNLVDSQLQRELQRRLDGKGCPVLAWSVHNMGPRLFGSAKTALLRAAARDLADSAIRTKEFRQGEVGYALYLDR